MRIIALLAGCVGALTLTLHAVAQPQVPATYFGSVTVDGHPAEAGTDVRGFVGGVDCTQASPGSRPVLREGTAAVYVLYVVHESQRPGCARDGSTVTFTIGGTVARQSAIWSPGPLRLDLSVGSEPPIPLPSSTSTIAPAIATTTGTVPATAPSASASVVPGATPGGAAALDPTPTVPPGGNDADDGDGASVMVFALVGLGALAAAAGGYGIYLAGRRAT